MHPREGGGTEPLPTLIPTLPADVRAGACARMRELVEEKRGALQLRASPDEAVEHAALLHVHHVGEEPYGRS